MPDAPLDQTRSAGHRTCRRCKNTEPAARFDRLARTLCRTCRAAEIEARPVRFDPRPAPVAAPASNLSQSAPHLARIRSMPCAAKPAAAPGPGAKPCGGRMHAHHVRVASGGGMGMKPGDRWCVPLCGSHHSELHTGGARTFEARYGVDLRAMAARLATLSPFLNQNNEATCPTQ